MASTDARPVPRKNVAFRLYFPILDADGDLVTGAAGLDSEVSIDGGTFADCTNEATEIATSSGMYFLDLVQAEMNGDAICLIVKTSTVGAKTTPIVLYPEEAGDYRADVTHFGGSAGTFASGRPEVNASHAAGTAWNSGAITANTLAADTLTAAKVAADVGTEIGTAVWATAARSLTVLDEDSTTLDLDATIRAAVGLASANLDTQVGDLPTNAELATALGTADDAVLTAIGDLPTNAELATALGTADDAVLTAIGDLPTNAELATALGTADDAILAAIAALNNLSAAEVNAEVVDALSTDTYAEPGQGAPGATIALSAKIGYLFKAWRNRTTQTASEYALYADDGTTKDHEAAVSDDGTTLDRGEVATGA